MASFRKDATVELRLQVEIGHRGGYYAERPGSRAVGGPGVDAGQRIGFLPRHPPRGRPPPQLVHDLARESLTHMSYPVM